jgi:glycosyltransferase involved in cell wall biosynthesis
MKYLVLLTKQFPFQWREQYVAHELEMLTSQFDKVFIYPHDHYRSNDKICFDIPPNVVTIDLNQDLVPASRFEVILPFLSAFFRELIYSKRKWYQLKAWRRFYTAFATQWALGNMLMAWQQRQGLERSEVLYYSYWMSASALCLSILKQRNRIDGYISRAHSIDLYHEDWGLLRHKDAVPPFRGLKERSASTIYSISKHGYNYLLNSGVDSNRAKISYLGVVDFGLGPEPKDEIYTVVTCSGIDENKRIHLLGEALSRLNREVRWVHFGDGPLLEQSINSVTSKSVHFECRGQTSNMKVREFYMLEPVHCFVNLSVVEGVPVSLMEAMSHGIPALATAVYGVPELVIDGYNGLTLPVTFSTEQIDNALLFFMNNYSQRKQMRTHARNHFSEHFNAVKNYNSFAKEIASIKL